MKRFISKDIFSHPVVLAAFGIVAAVAVGSVAYYLNATKGPELSQVPAADTSTAQPTAITGSGQVAPAQNPDVSFQTGGRVAIVNVTVGQTVHQGQTLASLDTSILSAAVAQAQANVSAQDAKLAELKAPARSVDVAAKQTAVDTARASLAALYQNIPLDLTNAYSSTINSLHSGTDSLFNNPNGSNPSLAFTTSNSQAAQSAVTLRAQVNGDISNWNTELASIGSADSSSLPASLSSGVTHLNLERQYLNALTDALSSAIPSSNFPQSSIASAQAAVSAMNTSVAASIATLQADSQKITSDTLAVTAAQDTLNQALAGATDQDIAAQAAQVSAAQASLQSAEASLRNAILTAPFSGTVTAVRVKSGDIIAAGTNAISLSPTSALQIAVYLSEVDAAKVAAGDPASVTLDAYGSGRVFAAQVVSVDRSPTTQNNIPAYKTTLQFETNDPSISSGMTANVTITPGSAASSTNAQ